MAYDRRRPTQLPGQQSGLKTGEGAPAGERIHGRWYEELVEQMVGMAAALVAN
jgi:hypothetical protein